jgi:hypothetical protein
VAGALRMIEGDRRELAERFAQERLRQVDEAAREIRKDLDEVRASLGFASRLFGASPIDGERQLRAQLAAVPSWRAIEVYDAIERCRRSSGSRSPRRCGTPRCGRWRSLPGRRPARRRSRSPDAGGCVRWRCRSRRRVARSPDRS